MPTEGFPAAPTTTVLKLTVARFAAAFPAAGAARAMARVADSASNPSRFPAHDGRTIQWATLCEFGAPNTPKAGPRSGPALRRGADEVVGYFCALTTELMSPAQVSVFFTRA